MSDRVLLCERQGGKMFRVTVPEGAKVTFGPWSPPSGKDRVYGGAEMGGTLRIYESKSSGASIIGCFTKVVSFRDDTLDYEEQVAIEKGASLWHSDQKGYKREESYSRETKWIGSGDTDAESEEDEV